MMYCNIPYVMNPHIVLRNFSNEDIGDINNVIRYKEKENNVNVKPTVQVT